MNKQFNAWLRELGDWYFANRKPLTKTALKQVMGKDYANDKIGFAFFSYIDSPEGETYFRKYLRKLKAKAKA